jgi:hypothetical protein
MSPIPIPPLCGNHAVPHPYFCEIPRAITAVVTAPQIHTRSRPPTHSFSRARKVKIEAEVVWKRVAMVCRLAEKGGGWRGR